MDALVDAEPHVFWSSMKLSSRLEAHQIPGGRFPILRVPCYTPKVTTHTSYSKFFSVFFLGSQSRLKVLGPNPQKGIVNLVAPGRI